MPLRRRLLVLGLASLATSFPDVVAAGPSRWPLWPNEVRQVAEALRAGSDATEAARAASIRRLVDYPNALVEELLVLGLADESAEVRREAMRACVARNLRACLPAAREAWMNTDDMAMRAQALDLFAAHPDDGRLELLVDALVDDDPALRDRALSALARAPLDAQTEARVRTLLQSKLDDVIAATRRRAAVALGLRGPGAGGVALVRHLDDPDPAVREAAAEALGRMEDVAAVAPLLRSLQQDPDRSLARAAVRALARIPDPQVDAALLELFDRPPLQRREPVVEAIGLRARPGPELVDGLIERMRDPGSHDAALRALQMMGPAAHPRIEAALQRGLEASVEGELRTTLAATRDGRRDPRPEAVASPPVADPRGRDETVAPIGARPVPRFDAARPLEARRALRDAPDRTAAGLELGRAAPGWLSGALSDTSRRVPLAETVRPWLWALVALPAGHLELSAPDRSQLVARLRAWSIDPGNRRSDACLALEALGSRALLDDARTRDLALAELEAATQDASPELRACSAAGVARLQHWDALEALLADPSPRVRAAAALSMLATPAQQRPRSLRARLAWMTQYDDHVGPRSCAALTRAIDGDAAPAGTRVWRAGPRDEQDAAWAHFEVRGRRVIAPVMGPAGDKWWVVPADLEASARPRAEIGRETTLTGTNRIQW